VKKGFWYYFRNIYTGVAIWQVAAFLTTFVFHSELDRYMALARIPIILIGSSVPIIVSSLILSKKDKNAGINS